MDLNPVIIAIPMYFVLMGIELIAQKFQKANYYRLNDALTNISCGIGDQVVATFSKVIHIGIYTFLFSHFALMQIESTWWSFIILFFAYDFCYYWAHRFSHEVNLFWSGHQVHHQSEEYNLSVALRQSWLQPFFTFYAFLPLAILGFSPMDFLLVTGLNLLYQFWFHTKAIKKMGFLELFMNTPSHHRVHHGRNPKYLDKNHAGVFIIWDKMFGTFQAEEEEVIYGLTTQIESWNPVWANFMHFPAMAEQVKSMPTLLDKIKVIFYKPGWRPKSQGGMYLPQEVDRASFKKFDTPKSFVLNVYITFHYVLMLVLAIFFLFKHADMTLTVKALSALFIALSIMNYGLLFELKKWALKLEFLRLFLGIGLVWLFDLNQDLMLYFGIAAGVYLGFSLLLLFKLIPVFEKREIKN